MIDTLPIEWQFPQPIDPLAARTREIIAGIMEKPMTQEQQIRCDMCGRVCTEGYETRVRGVDRETGYVDEEILCRSCLDHIPHLPHFAVNLILPEELL